MRQPRSDFEWASATAALTAVPAAALTANGWLAATEPTPYVMNWWQRLMHYWANVMQDGYDDTAGNPGQSNALWGPGIDGDVSITGAVTLARDMYYENLTFEDGGTMDVHGHRIFVRDTLDMSRAGFAAIWSNPADYASTTYGVLGDSIDPGTAGASPSAGSGLGGVAGGAGGKGGGELAATGTGAAGGASVSLTLLPFHPAQPGVSQFDRIRGGMAGSGGGNGGPSSAGGAGGRGGGGGGAIWISAKRLRRELGGTTPGAIRCVGEDGVDGANSAVLHKGGGGGGGGGCGGFVFVRTFELLGNGVVDMIDVSGGDGGEHGAGLGNIYAAVAGNGGAAGNIYYWNVDTNTFLSLTGATAGSAATVAGGGAGADLKGDL